MSAARREVAVLVVLIGIGLVLVLVDIVAVRYGADSRDGRDWQEGSAYRRAS